MSTVYRSYLVQCFRYPLPRRYNGCKAPLSFFPPVCLQLEARHRQSHIAKATWISDTSAVYQQHPVVPPKPSKGVLSVKTLCTRHCRAASSSRLRTLTTLLAMTLPPPSSTYLISYSVYLFSSQTEPGLRLLHRPYRHLVFSNTAPLGAPQNLLKQRKR